MALRNIRIADALVSALEELQSTHWCAAMALRLFLAEGLSQLPTGSAPDHRDLLVTPTGLV